MKTILFDLDGTLLPMDQDAFVKDYFGRLAVKLVPYGYDPQALIKGIWAGTGAMVKNDGSCTNEQAFWNQFTALFGEKSRLDEPIFEDYYKNEFQMVKSSCGFNAQAAETVASLKEMGYRLVLATNPIFPAIATMSRIRWAGLNAADFELVTTYENSCHCKPNLDYYRDILRTIGEDAQNCLMVGNDVGEDMVAKKLGIQVFLLTDCLINKTGEDISAYPNGSFRELMDYIKKRM